MAKLDGKKILACCANGAGSSLMMEIAIQKVMTKHNIKPAELVHCPISEGKSAASKYDLVFCSKSFAYNFEDVGRRTVVIPLKNVMSEAGLLDYKKSFVTISPLRESGVYTPDSHLKMTQGSLILQGSKYEKQ